MTRSVNKLYAGMVRNTFETYNGVEVQFVSHGPANSYFWPTRNEISWDPVEDIGKKMCCQQFPLEEGTCLAKYCAISQRFHENI